MRKGTQSRKSQASGCALEPRAASAEWEREAGWEGGFREGAGAVHGEPRSSAGSGLHPGQRERRRVLVGSSPSHRRFFLHSHAHTHVGAPTQPNPTGTRQRPPSLPSDPPCVAQDSFIPSALYLPWACWMPGTVWGVSGDQVPRCPGSLVTWKRY